MSFHSPPCHKDDGHLRNFTNVTSDVLTAVKMKHIELWVVTSFSLVETGRRFRGTRCF
jgi:hypothetical protein